MVLAAARAHTTTTEALFASRTCSGTRLPRAACARRLPRACAAACAVVAAFVTGERGGGWEEASGRAHRACWQGGGGRSEEAGGWRGVTCRGDGVLVLDDLLYPIPNNQPETSHLSFLAGNTETEKRVRFA